MTLSFFTKGARHRLRISRGLPCDLPPHLLRDIGLDPLPVFPRLSFYPLW